MKSYHHFGILADTDPAVLLAYEEQRARETALVIDDTDPQAEYE